MWVKSDGAVSPSAFKDRGDSMSMDWSRYSTPEEARDRAREPLDNGVLSFVAGYVREIPLEVTHAPVPENRAHTDVLGTKDEEVRVKLRRIARVELPVAPIGR